MKKLLTLVITLSLMLTGCAKADEMLKSKNLIASECVIVETTDSPLPIDEENPFFAEKAEVFRSYDELREYTEKITVCDSTEKIINQLKTYDESFFEENMLYYGYEHGSGNIKFEISGVALNKGENGTVEVYAKADYEQCVLSGASYGFFVKLAKSDVESVNDESFTLVTYDKS